MPRTSMILAAALALMLGAASAQTNAPLTQGISSVEKNLERDPENKGLLNASERLERNRQRFEERQDARPARPDFAQRPERV